MSGLHGLGVSLTTAVILTVSAGSTASAETVSVDLTLVPATDQVNRVHLTLSVVALGVPNSDTESTTVTGNALADLTVGFNHATHEATVTGLEFTGGEYSFSPVQFELGYPLLGSIHATAEGIGGTLDTPNPPGSVAGQTFPAEQHEAIVSRGVVHAWATGYLETRFEPMTIDLSDEPIPAPGSGTGTLVVSSAALAAEVAWYDVILELPLNFSETVYEDELVSAGISGTGRFRAEGRFSRRVPILGDVNGDGLVTAADIDVLYDHVPSTEPAYDVNGDGVVSQADVDALVRGVLGSEYGDANLDGRVDFLDYLAFKCNVAGGGPAGWLDCDFDGDDDVDGLDFDLLEGGFGFSAPGGATAAPGAVPEPAALSLLALGACLSLRKKRGRESFSA